MKNFTKTLIGFPALALLFIAALALSCSKEDDGNNDTQFTCETCAGTPEALAANDHSAKGIYKGTVTGSTGTISINIQNGSSTVTATMVLDGVTVTLTSAVSVVAGESYVAPFTGTYNGSPVSITFSIGADGGSPTMVASDIPGHPNAVFQLYKETSTSLIEAFEGTYVAEDGAGTFNVVLSRGLNKWGYTAKANSDSEINSGSGIIQGNDLYNEEGEVVGVLDGDEIHGTTAVEIEGYRTL